MPSLNHHRSQTANAATPIACPSDLSKARVLLPSLSFSFEIKRIFSLNPFLPQTSLFHPYAFYSADAGNFLISKPSQDILPKAKLRQKEFRRLYYSTFQKQFSYNPRKYRWVLGAAKPLGEGVADKPTKRRDSSCLQERVVERLGLGARGRLSPTGFIFPFFSLKKLYFPSISCNSNRYFCFTSGYFTWSTSDRNMSFGRIQSEQSP